MLSTFLTIFLSAQLEDNFKTIQTELLLISLMGLVEDLYPPLLIAKTISSYQQSSDWHTLRLLQRQIDYQP